MYAIMLSLESCSVHVQGTVCGFLNGCVETIILILFMCTLTLSTQA